MLIAHSEWVHHSGKAQPPADVRQGLLNSEPQQGTLGPLPEATGRAGNVATALLSPPGPIVRICVLWGRLLGIPGAGFGPLLPFPRHTFHLLLLHAGSAV